MNMLRLTLPNAARAALAALMAMPAIASSCFAADRISAGETKHNAVRVSSFDNYIFTVADLDKSFAFYRNVIGLEVSASPSPAEANEMIGRLTNTPGSLFRTASFRIPRTTAGLLLTEFAHISRRILKPKNVDPGAVTMAVSVRDLDPVLAAAKLAGTPVVTRGGVPLEGRPGMRAIVFLDPDGFYVNVSQTPPPSDGVSTAVPNAAADTSNSGNIITARAVYTVADPATAEHFYRDVLGFNVDHGKYALSENLDTLIDAPGALFNSTHATPEGSMNFLEFVAFKDVARHTYHGRPQDPGTPAISLVVPSLDAALRAVTNNGATVISSEGKPVSTSRGGESIFIRDPSGVLLEIKQHP